MQRRRSIFNKSFLLSDRRNFSRPLIAQPLTSLSGYRRSRRAAAFLDNGLPGKWEEWIDGRRGRRRPEWAARRCASCSVGGCFTKTNLGQIFAFRIVSMSSCHAIPCHQPKCPNYDGRVCVCTAYTRIRRAHSSNRSVISIWLTRVQRNDDQAASCCRPLLVIQHRQHMYLGPYGFPFDKVRPMYSLRASIGNDGTEYFRSRGIAKKESDIPSSSTSTDESQNLAESWTILNAQSLFSVSRKWPPF